MRLRFLALLFVATGAFAQRWDSFHFGVKTGADYYQFLSDGRNDATSQAFGYYVGLFFQAKIDEDLFLCPEVLYVGHKRDQFVHGIGYTVGGMPMAGEWGEMRVREGILQFPLMTRYRFSREFFGEVGPQVAYSIERNYDPIVSGNVPSQITQKPDYEKVDFTLAAGVGLHISSNFAFTARAYVGLTKREYEARSAGVNLGIMAYFK
ncbi:MULTISPECIES: porin family protein [unclassified Flavobacterium]|uniref:porin family protein n=1 Tax=unclassified Flavobacterium TaxID=196869 RepID=UPI001F136FEC|nr:MULTISPECIES: porin family protein [unclassified Flavobacterium]UMY67111.1 PorT family protein [Flavobacterium sp. HJ-32-4]